MCADWSRESSEQHCMLLGAWEGRHSWFGAIWWASGYSAPFQATCWLSERGLEWLGYGGGLTLVF